MNSGAPLDDDLGWMLGVAFRAYARASEDASAICRAAPVATRS
ncbi:hypothetical protein [Nakamurella deserti]|nr:hypothetical protein [Nakamurella deserti]